MGFVTKKYTKPALRRAVRKVNVNSFIDFKSFVKALSPRAGRTSAQITVLRQTLNAPLDVLFAGSAKNNKSYILSLLK